MQCHSCLKMTIYIYLCVCVGGCLHVYVHVCMYVIYMYLYVCVVCVYVYIYIYIYIYMCVSVCVHVYACMCVFYYVFIYSLCTHSSFYFLFHCFYCCFQFSCGFFRRNTMRREQCSIEHCCDSIVLSLNGQLQQIHNMHTNNQIY